MNKEELKKEIKDRGHIKANSFVLISQHDLSSLIDQLDEPEKPVVPSFIADYIERAKPRHDSLYQAMEERAGEEVNEWIQAFYNSDLFARAWLYGYEVEKETFYHMPVPYQKSDQVYYCGVGNNITTKWSADKYWHHQYTQEELDKYFPDIKHMAEEVEDND